MDNAVKVSVIIPCYNVEKYLKACLKSLVNQTFSDFEVLLIDDGSTDATGEIASAFDKENENFKYYRTENKGPGHARNYGINLAKGEYIAFVDSDDTVSPYYLEKLYNTACATNADIVCCNYSKYYDKNNSYYKIKFRKQKTGEYTNVEMMQLLLNDWTVRSYLWNKFFKKSIFTDNDLSFPNMYFEDIVTVFKAAYYAEKVVAIPDTLYNYSIRPNSIMTSYNVDKYNDYAMAYHLCREFAKEHGLLKKLTPNFMRTACVVYFANTYMLVSMHAHERSMRGLPANFSAGSRTVFRIYFGGKKPFIVDGNVPFPIRHPNDFKKPKEIEPAAEQTTEKRAKQKVKQ